MATSADKRQPDCVLSVAVLLGLFGCSGLVVADDEQPDMEFLEYLGSWEESDEDWLLFDGQENEPVAADGNKRSGPELEGKESTESEDES
jgi:hypothetical protein